nr:hypothetical protein [Paramarasmius palmivorus]
MKKINFLFRLFYKIIINFCFLTYIINYNYAHITFLLGSLFGIFLYFIYYYIKRLDFLYITLKSINKFLFFLFLVILLYYYIEFYVYTISDLFSNTIYIDDNKTLKLSDIRIDMDKAWDGITFLGGASVFSAGIKASASVFKSSAVSLPPTFKMAFILAGGGASYFTFEDSRSIWRASTWSKTQPADHVDITKRGDNFESSSNVEPSCPLENETYLAHLVDVLQNSFNLYICIFIIINLCIIFLILKSLSDLNYNFDWLSKYKYGNKIRIKLVNILSYWRKSNLLFFYIGMFMIWLFSAFNIMFIKYVLLGLQSL